MNLSIIFGSALLINTIVVFLLKSSGSEISVFKVISLAMLILLPAVTSMMTVSLLGKISLKVYGILFVGTIAGFLSTTTSGEYLVAATRIVSYGGDITLILNGITKALSLGASAALILSLIVASVEAPIAWIYNSNTDLTTSLAGLRSILLIMLLAFTCHRLFEFWLHGWASILGK